MFAPKEKSNGGQDLRLNPAARTVHFAGRDIHLTPTEFRVLECLMREPGRPFTRAELMAACIAGGAIVLERTIDQHVCGVRRKLGGRYIETVRRVGYRFQASDDITPSDQDSE